MASDSSLNDTEESQIESDPAPDRVLVLKCLLCFPPSFSKQELTFSQYFGETFAGTQIAISIGCRSLSSTSWQSALRGVTAQIEFSRDL